MKNLRKLLLTGLMTLALAMVPTSTLVVHAMLDRDYQDTKYFLYKD